jgi:D-alanyl-D-alanine dipeptidase
MGLGTKIRMHAVSAFTKRAYSNGRDWKQLPIQENGERMVEVPPGFCHPYYAVEMKLTQDTRLFLRREVFSRFLKANALVGQEGFELRVYDGWRPVSLQKNLFWHYMREFTAAKFNMAAKFAGQPYNVVEELFGQLPPDQQVTMKAANRIYVSWPSDDPNAPSPHATGGSIDVWLYQNGIPCDLGVPFDWMEEDAGAFYHLKWKRNRFKTNEARVIRHREILVLAMVDAGFTCYPPEIWHYNYGNQMDSLVRARTAIYSYTEPKE